MLSMVTIASPTQTPEMTRCFLLLVLLRISLLAKQLSLVHAFSPSSSPSAARPSLVGAAAARRNHRSLSTVTMISVDNNNNNAVEEENGLSLFTSSSTRRDVLLAAIAAAITTTTATTAYPPLPAMAAAEAAIVVAGATGQTGRRILERLSKATAGGDVTTSAVIVGGVRDTTRAYKSLSESSTVIRGAMIQRVDSVNLTSTTNGEGGGGGGGRLELKHLDVVKDTVEELKDTLTGASALVIATGFVPGNPLKMNAAAHEVDNVGTCKLIVSSDYMLCRHLFFLEFAFPNIILHSLSSLTELLSLLFNGISMTNFFFSHVIIIMCNNTCTIL